MSAGKIARCLIVVLMFMSWGCKSVPNLPYQFGDDVPVDVLVGAEKVTLHVKQSRNARIKGLSGILTAPDDGALFVFSHDGDAAFTMRTQPPMQFDLDIAFFDSDQRLIHIETSKIGDSSIKPDGGKQYRYVVETLPGRLMGHGTQSGDRLELLSGMKRGCQQILLPEWGCPLPQSDRGTWPLSFEAPRGFVLQQASEVRCAQKVIECVAASVELERHVEGTSYCVKSGNDDLMSGTDAYAAMWTQAAPYKETAEHENRIPVIAGWPDWRPLTSTNAATSAAGEIQLRRYRVNEGLRAIVNTLSHEMLHAIDGDPEGYYFTDLTCTDGKNGAKLESVPYGFEGHFETLGCEVLRQAGGGCL